MKIQNTTNRTLDIIVNAQSSQTIWSQSVDPNVTIEKQLDEKDAPYTVLGRWKADPALQYNFILGENHRVPNNKSGVKITIAYPGFSANLS